MDDVKRIQDLIEMHCSFRMDGCDCVDMKEKCSACLAKHLVGHGVTVQKRGRWLNRGEGHAAFVECSECHVCGSPQWKVCPVCETKMD